MEWKFDSQYNSDGTETIPDFKKKLWIYQNFNEESCALSALLWNRCRLSVTGVTTGCSSALFFLFFNTRIAVVIYVLFVDLLEKYRHWLVLYGITGM